MAWSDTPPAAELPEPMLLHPVLLHEDGLHSVCLPPSFLGSWNQMSKSYLSTGYPVGSDGAGNTKTLYREVLYKP